MCSLTGVVSTLAWLGRLTTIGFQMQLLQMRHQGNSESVTSTDSLGQENKDVKQTRGRNYSQVITHSIC